MSEESQETNDGTLSGLKKTIIGILGTVATAGGVYITTLLGGGHKEEAPAAPIAAPAPIININNTQQATPITTIIKEKTIETPTGKPEEVKKPKKEGSEFKDKPAQW